MNDELEGSRSLLGREFSGIELTKQDQVNAGPLNPPQRLKPKIRLRLETAHVQPEASETLTQHRANPASTSRSEGLRPDYTHSVFLAHHHPTARLLGSLGIPSPSTPNPPTTAQAPHTAGTTTPAAPPAGPAPAGAERPADWSSMSNNAKWHWRQQHK